MQTLEIEKNLKKIMDSKLHGNALRAEIKNLFEIYGIKEYRIFRTKRGYIVYFKLPEKG